MNDAAEIKIRAEYKAGKLLKEMEKRNGGHAAKARSHDVTEFPPTLSDLGVSKNESSRWQLLATIPDAEFDAKLQNERAAVRAALPLTPSGNTGRAGRDGPGGKRKREFGDGGRAVEVGEG